MTPLLRQLDRASAVSAPAEGPARRLPAGSVHQAAPAPHGNGTPSGPASSHPVCAVATCSASARSLGWCKPHYDRWRRTGSPVPATAVEMFWSRFVRRPSGCWEWQGPSQATGHGRLSLGGKTVQAHRFSYELLVEPIPEGLVIDHLCQNPPCVNPMHMEPVTIAENTRRATSVIHLTDHCAVGHRMDEANTYVVPSSGQRRCRECYRQRARVNQARLRGRSEPYPARVTTGQRAEASYACACGHSRHAHEGYGRCLVPGCVCWAVRKPSTQERDRRSWTAAENVCSVEECNEGVRSRGLCITHYEKWRIATTDKVCSVDECLDPARARGMCDRHYGIWYRTVGRDQPRPTWEDRFWSKVDKGGHVPTARPELGPCWEWTAHRCNKGYGKTSIRKPGDDRQRAYKAHRVAYELLVGPIPVDRVIDHLCRNRPCVNPAHLEPVTALENTLRGFAPTAIAARTDTCLRGHSLADALISSRGHRACRTCRREQNRRAAARRKANRSQTSNDRAAAEPSARS